MKGSSNVLLAVTIYNNTTNEDIGADGHLNQDCHDGAVCCAAGQRLYYPSRQCARRILTRSIIKKRIRRAACCSSGFIYWQWYYSTVPHTTWLAVFSLHLGAEQLNTAATLLPNRAQNYNNFPAWYCAAALYYCCNPPLSVTIPFPRSNLSCLSCIISS